MIKCPVNLLREDDFFEISGLIRVPDSASQTEVVDFCEESCHSSEH